MEIETRRCAKICAVNTTLSLTELYRPVEDPLEQVREQMRQVWTEALRLVRIEAGPLPQLGGKMLRPALCLLSAGALGLRDLEKYVPLAASYEALHIASLAHDDVIDRALLRRGSNSLNALWDNHAAVLGGDSLVARAVELLGVYDSAPLIVHAISCVRLMAEGELLFFGRSAASITEEDCLQLARQKTASLFAEACSAPAHLAGGTPAANLYDFGLHLGVAFQVVDDLLDLTQPEEQLGKPACGDVAEGKVTLPLLYMRKAMQPHDLARLEQLTGNPLSESDRFWVQEQLELTGAREQTQALIHHYSQAALDQLHELPPTSYRDSMEGLVELLATRSS
jgi:octaprenyl-diphosphate synthase